jgi:uncharacterized OsmC-like protein
MIADFERLRSTVEHTAEALRNGEKAPDRTRRVELRVIADLETEVATGEHIFRVDAAMDAGGGARAPRPMDYVLGGLVSCQQMWCLRWAALTKTSVTDLKISATGHFTWQGEYLDEVDAGLTLIETAYRVAGSSLDRGSLLHMADMVARRCPVFATLRKSAPIAEYVYLNDALISQRRWQPGRSRATVMSTP